MRIDLRSAYDPGAIEQAQKTSSKGGAAKAQMTDSTDLSTEVQLSSLEGKVASAPDIRQDKVDQLRQAIASGTYSVTDEQLADAMIRDALRR